MKSRHLLCQVSEVQLVARTSLTVPLQGVMGVQGAKGFQRMSKGLQSPHSKALRASNATTACVSS